MGSDKDNNRYNRVKDEKCSVQQGNSVRASRYNNSRMLEQTILIKNGFAHRLTVLRMTKGISAREMSLSMGMTANYINSIENGENLPSMGMFFEICETLDVTPKEFFDYAELQVRQKAEIEKHIEKLNGEKLDILLRLIKMIEK